MNELDKPMRSEERAVSIQIHAAEEGETTERWKVSSTEVLDVVLDPFGA